MFYRTQFIIIYNILKSHHFSKGTDIKGGRGGEKIKKKKRRRKKKNIKIFF